MEEHNNPFSVQGANFWEFESEPAKLRANLYFTATHIYCDILQVFPHHISNKLLTILLMSYLHFDMGTQLLSITFSIKLTSSRSMLLQE